MFVYKLISKHRLPCHYVKGRRGYPNIKTKLLSQPKIELSRSVSYSYLETERQNENRRIHERRQERDCRSHLRTNAAADHRKTAGKKKRWISRGLFVLDRYAIAAGKQIDRGKKKCMMKSIWKNCVFGFDLRHAASSTDLEKRPAQHTEEFAGRQKGRSKKERMNLVIHFAKRLLTRES